MRNTLQNSKLWKNLNWKLIFRFSSPKRAEFEKTSTTISLI
jgi:hypothetical protein